jgi:hypothetical protein
VTFVKEWGCPSGRGWYCSCRKQKEERRIGMARLSQPQNCGLLPIQSLLLGVSFFPFLFFFYLCVYSVLGMEHKTLHMLGKHYTTEPHLLPSLAILTVCSYTLIWSSATLTPVALPLQLASFRVLCHITLWGSHPSHFSLPLTWTCSILFLPTQEISRYTHLGPHSWAAISSWNVCRCVCLGPSFLGDSGT